MSKSYAERVELLSRHICDGVALHQLCCEGNVAPAEVFRWWSELPDEERERLVGSSTIRERIEADPACEIVAQSIAGYRDLHEARLAPDVGASFER
jgi:hypothetical protein